jgi:hypothetical protein
MIEDLVVSTFADLSYMDCRDSDKGAATRVPTKVPPKRRGGHPPTAAATSLRRLGCRRVHDTEITCGLLDGLSLATEPLPALTVVSRPALNPPTKQTSPFRPDRTAISKRNSGGCW